MLKFTIDDQSARDHFAEVKLRVLEAVRLGMSKAMAGLAWKAAGNAPMMTGKLRESIINSAKVKENATLIRGNVSAYSKGKPVGLWQEFGVHVPAIANKLIVFVTPNGQVVFSRGHKAFDVPARPFMNQSLGEYRATIIETIAEHIREATK